ncbi:hypothetical protein NQ315_007329 [Exocentrus adspersus]|uniref:Ionotropic receptor 75a N-terminal domain-containing protein n=1 Tax=Exocentrus adspersus TaxID=1586481 RepID=A0AAV8WE48_9CUCU|nr:hypothetical protein NQ315_007329 [Exocentrus adspersus]
MGMMQLTRQIILLNFLLIIPVNGFLDYDIIDGYFKHRHIHYASIIGCFSTRKEQLRILKRFIMKPMTSIFDLNKIIVKNVFRTSLQLGIVVDGDCEGVKQLLEISGHHNYFNENYHWLVLTLKGNITYIFENVRMYINADIQIVFPESVINYTVLEVYNPAHGRGGSVKFHKVGFYNSYHKYKFKAQRRCKYWIRRNMTGVTLRSLIVLPIHFEGRLLDYLNKEDQREINTFNRFNYNLISSCQRYYNFS